MHKYQIINLLFLISFPVYGAGAYVAAKLSPSVGYVVLHPFVDYTFLLY
jgi:hypothetical protein